MDEEMTGPYDGVRDQVMALVTADRAAGDLERYLKRPGGGQFERLLDHDSPDSFYERRLPSAADAERQRNVLRQGTALRLRP